MKGGQGGAGGVEADRGEGDGGVASGGGAGVWGVGWGVGVGGCEGAAALAGADGGGGDGRGREAVAGGVRRGADAGRGAGGHVAHDASWAELIHSPPPMGGHCGRPLRVAAITVARIDATEVVRSGAG